MSVTAISTPTTMPVRTDRGAGLWLFLIAAMIGMNIIFALSPGSGIDWTAHVGGMAFGWIFLKLSSLGGLTRVKGWV